MKPDPEKLTWINPATVKPGSTNCGFMTAPLGPDTADVSVEVYVCAHFAETQPAPLGALFVHCGGPGSLSDCLQEAMLPDGSGRSYPSGLSDSVRAQYDVFSVDQRGLGRSSPSFLVPACSTENVFAAADPTDEQSVREFLQKKKKTTQACYASPEFQLAAADGSGRTYNFLEYSGTSALVEDIDLLRTATGHDKISLYGISYGTNVCGAYATVYPAAVDKLVLDSNDMSKTDMLQSALDAAAGQQQVYDRLAFLCETDARCPIEDVAASLRAIQEKLGEREAIEVCGMKMPTSNLLGHINKGNYVQALVLVQQLQKDINDDAKFWDRLTPAVEQELGCGAGGAYEQQQQARRLEGQEQAEVNAAELCYTSSECMYDQPTVCEASEGLCFVQGRPDYLNMSDTPQSMILAQDYTNFAYSEEYFIGRWKQMRELYTNMGLSHAAYQFVFYWGIGYYWPANSPVPPLSNPKQGGLILGQVFDPNTPYKWTVEMKQAFPMTGLITSNDIRHGAGQFNKNIVGGEEVEGACNAHITDYLLTGAQVTDGTTCGTPSDLHAQFEEAFGSGGAVTNGEEQQEES